MYIKSVDLGIYYLFVIYIVDKWSAMLEYIIL